MLITCSTSCIQATNRLTDEEELYPRFVCYLFNDLLSGNNDIFTQTIQREKDDWEKRTDVSHKDLISMASSKFKNMIANGSWEKKDPKDSKIAALTTLVQKLVDGKGTLKQAAFTTNVNASKGEMVLNCGSLEKWRMAKNEDSIEKDGQKWWWCPHHVHPKGLFNGSYMPHPPYLLLPIIAMIRMALTYIPLYFYIFCYLDEFWNTSVGRFLTLIYFETIGGSYGYE